MAKTADRVVSSAKPYVERAERMQVWIPIIVQVVEALIVGGIAGVTAYQVTHDWQAAIAAALAALAGKITPKQVIPIEAPPKS